MNKVRDYLTKDVKEFNVKLLVISGILFLFVMGLISYKITINESYALFTDTVTGSKTLTFHYEESGKAFSEEIVNKLKKKATNIDDGVYYFDEDGNLDYGNGTVIQLDLKTTIPKGVVSIWNKTPIYVCTNYGDDNYEYDQVTKQVNTRTLPCLENRYQNLVINGDLSYGDNTNLTQFGDYNNGGYLSKTSSTMFGPVADDYIPIDPNKAYTISVDMKASNTTANYYVGLYEYDVDFRSITAKNVMYIENTLTELTQDLKSPDTVVHLANLTNWNNSTSSSEYYKRGFIFWNYKDSTGYSYPDLTYSVNKYVSSSPALYENSGMNKTNNTITLTNSWSGPTIPAGTKVSQSSDSSTYNYSVLQADRLKNSWDTYTATINGINNTGTVSRLLFRHGVKFVRFYGFMNNNSTANTTTYIKNISIKEVKE